MKRLLKKSTSLLLALCMILTALTASSIAFAANGVITGAKNTVSGIKITWSKDSTKTGYYVYRKAGSGSSWAQVKKFTSNSTTSWEDKNVTDGTRYTYKVCTYKGSNISKTDVTKVVYRVKRPTVNTLSSPDVGCIRVVTSENQNVSGYEIQYSKSSSFSNATTIKVGGVKKVDKYICSLSPNTKYYVRVRAYMLRSSTMHYSVWTASKYTTTKASYTAYTIASYTSIYVKPDSSSSKVSLPYNTKVTLGSVYSNSSQGKWQKVTYNSKTYYTWFDPGAQKFSKSKAPNLNPKAVNNTSSIKVSWTMDGSKNGYYVYRKVGLDGGEWKQVAKITDNKVTSWTDKNVVDGTRYSYRIRGYVGSTIYEASESTFIYRVVKPTIKSAVSDEVGAILVKSSENQNVSGYEVMLSKSSDFSNAQTIKVGGVKKIDKYFCQLSPNTTYYVKIRAYMLRSEVNHYSVWSAVKTVKTDNSFTAYTAHLNTSIYSRPTTNSEKSTITYMSEVVMKELYSKSSQGKWQKVIYNSKTYYTWFDDGEDKFTKTKNPYIYEDSRNSKYQQEVVDKAVYIFKNWDTTYVKNANGDSSNGIPNADGKYEFDCSGFVSYVINSTMRQYVPVYMISPGIEKICKTGVLYNPGYKNEFKAETICDNGVYEIDKMQPGDIIIFNLSKGLSQNAFPWNHCGIYLGNNQFIHSTPSADGVTIIPIEDAYSREMYKVIRVIPKEIKQINEEYSICPTPGNRNVKVYSEPKVDDKVLQDRLPEDTRVELIYVSGNGNYGMIRYDGDKTGFIYSPATRLK